MATDRFNLDNPKAETQTYILLRISLADGRLKYSTKQKLHPSQWDQISQRASLKDKEQTKKNKAINHTLSDISRIIDKLQEEYNLLRKPLTMSIVRNRLDDYFNTTSTKLNKDATFHELIETYINGCESGVILTKANKRFSAETIKGYRHSQANLKKYEKARRTSLHFDTLTMEVVNDIKRYFNDQDHAINSIGKTIKNLKVFIKATDKHHSNNIASKIRIPAEETPDIYLTDEDIKQLLELNLENKRYDLVRDRFVLDCYLGLRVSDMKLLNDQHVTDKFFMIATDKTDEKVVIPIHPTARKILDKYKGVPPTVTDQEMNRIIKEVAHKAKLREQFLYTVTKGGVRKDFYMQKWQMVSNHTARRTFITNLLKAGVPDHIVMKLAGIKKAQTLQRYNKLSHEESAELAAKHEYFMDEHVKE